MSKILAADAIRASIKHYKQLAEYADLLEKQGAMEQAEQEVIAATARARKDLDAVNALLVKANASVKQSLDTLAANEKAAASMFADGMANAQESAEALLGNAKAKSREIIAKATAKAIKLETDADKAVAEAKQAVEAESKEIKGMQTKRAEIEADLEAITAKLAAAKAQVADILKGE